jgi:hypothetical protein
MQARYNKIRGKRWWTWDGSMLQCCSGETGGRSAVQEKNSWAVLLRLLYETAMAMMSELKHTTPPSNYTIYLKVYFFRFLLLFSYRSCVFECILECLMICLQE